MRLYMVVKARFSPIFTKFNYFICSFKIILGLNEIEKKKNMFLKRF